LLLQGGVMRLPSNKAVATVEMIVHSAVGKGGGADEAGFDATLQFDGLTDAESMAAAAAAEKSGSGHALCVGQTVELQRRVEACLIRAATLADG
jgi:hypothetical protein